MSPSKKDFQRRSDDWQMRRVPARERRRLFTFWSCGAVEGPMQRPDIIRRAVRWTGVRIDIEGKLLTHIRFPGFETYEPPTKDEEHVDELFTEDEIKALEQVELEYQKEKKKRKKVERDGDMRERAKKRAKTW